MALWCGVIFAFSTKVGAPGVTPGLADLLLRKGAHVFEYAVLWALVRRALSGGGTAGPGWKAFAFCVLYGASDEWHQTFVPFREGRLTDVAVDGLGAALGALAWRVRNLFWGS